MRKLAELNNFQPQESDFTICEFLIVFKKCYSFKIQSIPYRSFTKVTYLTQILESVSCTFQGTIIIAFFNRNKLTTYL